MNVMGNKIVDHYLRIIAVNEIVSVLAKANAIKCVPMVFADDEICYKPGSLSYKIPNGYHVEIDFEKLATAIYDAGYRKSESENTI